MKAKRISLFLPLMVGMSLPALQLVRAQDALAAKPDDWEAGDANGMVSEAEEGAVKYKGPGGYRLVSKNVIEIDATKSYRLTGLFRSDADEADGARYFGLVPLDDFGTVISCNRVNVIEDTATELAADCNPNDKVVVIANGANWRSGPECSIAFNADDSGAYADLPSTELSPDGITGVEHMGDTYEVRLNQGVPRFYPAGTKVREHSAGPSGIYAVIRNSGIPAEWTEFSGIIGPEASHGAAMNSWWKGTKKVRVVITGPGGPSGSAVTFKDIRLEEVP